ncbi:MAG TPA: outer membrane protein assembly factor BamD [Candidatus Acidoferrales bacterium]
MKRLCTLLPLLLVALLLAQLPAGAVAKEIIQLQRDVALLQQQVRDLQQSVTQNHAVLKTLVEQATDSVNRMNASLATLQKTVQDAQANTNARTDTLAGQVQALADGLEEVKARLARLSQQFADTQGVIQSMDAKLAAAAQPPPSATPPVITPPMSGEVLYQNALRDLNGGKFDLARQEFNDYLKYFPAGEFASNSQFYIGETHYQQARYAEAVVAYDKGLLNYPRGNKVPESYLKKGFALIELGQRAAGSRELRIVVQRFPNTDAGRLARERLRRLTTP